MCTIAGFVSNVCVRHVDVGTHSPLGNVYANFHQGWFTRLWILGSR